MNIKIKVVAMMEKLRSFIKREDGASAIEYALIAGLIAVAIITAAGSLGDQISTFFEYIATELSDTTP